MTVAQLILELQKIEVQDSEVYVGNEDGDFGLCKTVTPIYRLNGEAIVYLDTH